MSDMVYEKIRAHKPKREYKLSDDYVHLTLTFRDDVMTWKRFPHFWVFVREIRCWAVI